MRPAFTATDRLAIEEDRVTVAYHRLEAPPGFFARLLWGEGAGEEMRSAVAAPCWRVLRPTGAAEPW